MLISNLLTMTQKTTESENLSRIKDILFGEDLQSIDKQFDTFKVDNKEAFNQLKNEIEERFKKIENLLVAKNTKVEKVQEESVELQKNINTDFKEEITKVSLDVIKEKARIEKVINEREDNFSEKITLLEKQLKSMIEKVLIETISKYDDLNNNKVNKSILADLFSGLSEELKK